MKTGLAIYSGNLNNAVEFYSDVLELDVIEKDQSYALLGSSTFELSILETKMSKALSKATDKPVPRESTPIKPIYFLNASLDSISEKVNGKGGVMFPPKEWELDGRIVCDGCDCEGNIFQLRLQKTHNN